MYTNDDLNRILEIYLGAIHKFSEVWFVSFQGGKRSSYLGRAVPQRHNFNNSFFSSGPQLNYQVTEKLSLSPGYRFSCTGGFSPVRTASNHQTWLMLTYSYPIHYQK